MFFTKIDIFCKSIAGPLSEAKTHWTLYGVIPRCVRKICVNDVFEMFNYWEWQWIDVDGASCIYPVTATIFSGVRTVFGFLHFGLSMRMPVSFTFFTRWRWKCKYIVFKCLNTSNTKVRYELWHYGTLFKLKFTIV